MCADADCGRARARRECREPQPPLRVPGLLPALHERGRRAGQVPRRTGPFSLRPVVRVRRGAVGRPPDPRSHRVLLLQFVPRPGGRVLSQPRRRHRVAAAARGVAGARAVEPAARDPRARRRGTARLRTAGPARASTASSSRSTPATSSPAWFDCAGGDSTAARRRGGEIEASSTGSARRAGRSRTSGRDERARLRDPRRPPRAVRSRSHDRVPPARAMRRGGETIHSLALRCQIRIEPQRRRYAADEEASARGAVRRDPALGRHAEAVPLDARLHHGARLHRDRESSTSRCPARTTSRSPPRSTFTPSRTATIPLLFLFSGTVFAKGDGGLAGDAGAVGS